jgi:hypothetical protein
MHIVPVEKQRWRSNEGVLLALAIHFHTALAVGKGRNSRKTEEVGRGSQRHDGSCARQDILDKKSASSWT